MTAGAGRPHHAAPPDLSLRIAETPEDVAACMALRWAVFVEEQGVPPADEIDGQDDACTHVIACVGADIIGAARFRMIGDAVKIQRVCVVEAARGTGAGAAIIGFICQVSGARRAKLSAQTDALAFYEKLGFATRGDVYRDAGIPHQDMEKSLR